MVYSCDPLSTHNSLLCNLCVIEMNKDERKLSLLQHLFSIWKLTNLNWGAKRCRHMFTKGFHCDLIDGCPNCTDESVWTRICYILTCLCCSGEVCVAHVIGVSTPRLLFPSHQQSTVIHSATHIDNLLNSYVQGERIYIMYLCLTSIEHSNLTTQQTQKGKIRLEWHI